MKQATPRRRSRHALLDDTGGNTLMMAGAMLFPLLGFVGSGIDISRGYMAKTQLQAACDAGVLAARKVELTTKLTVDARRMGSSFFNANFAKQVHDAENVTFSMALSDSGTLRGQASADVPTSVMSIAGFDTLDIAVTCAANKDLSSTDVMFVLDTTGSMEQVNPGDGQTRFEAMKDAVIDFHEELESAKVAGVRMRYGFVPYAETVNVGYLLKTEWMVDRWQYQSRVPAGSGTTTRDITYEANWRTIRNPWTETRTDYAPTVTTTPPTAGTEFSPGSTGGTYLTCPRQSSSLVWTGHREISRTSTPVPGGTRTVVVIEQDVNGSDTYSEMNGSTCTEVTRTFSGYVQQFDRITEPSTTTQYTWRYAPIEYDVSQLRGLDSGGEVTAPIGDQHKNVTFPYRGCIEERDTTRNEKFDPIPASAYDLMIDLVPRAGQPATQWRPALPELVFMRRSLDVEVSAADYPSVTEHWGNVSSMCPAPARKLGEMSRYEVETYLDTLHTGGGTYHDIGVIWGARLLSPTGLFAAENAGKQSRHMVFMTDGKTETNINRYDSYAYSKLDRRRNKSDAVEPTDAEQNLLVERRFVAICREARNRGITLWVIAFGTELNAMMTDCAGVANAFQANDAAQLNKAFKDIAGKISRLRLTE